MTVAETSYWDMANISKGIWFWKEENTAKLCICRLAYCSTFYLFYILPLPQNLSFTMSPLLKNVRCTIYS
jgi:hypothetical protein